MSPSLLLLNLKTNRTGLVGWALFLGAYALFVVYLYPSIDDASYLVDQLRGLPLEVQTAIGLGEETLETVFPQGEFSFYGAMATQYLVWWPVFVGIYAILFGSAAVAGDVESGVTNILLCQPLRRYKILLSKTWAFMLVLSVLGVISWSAVMAAAVVNDIDVCAAKMAIAHAVGMLLVLAIFSYSVMASSIFGRARSALGMAALVTFAFYMINLMAPTFGEAGWLQNGSLFYFYQPFRLLTDAEVNWVGIAAYGGIVIGCHVVALYAFQRRDLVR